MASPPTRFVDLGRARALVLMAAVAVAMAVLLALALLPGPPVVTSSADSGGGDAALYAAIVDHMRAGEGYYPATHAEMLANGYGTQSVFNWRTPLYPTLLATAGGLVGGQVALSLLALAAALAAIAWVWQTTGRQNALLLGVLLMLSLAAVVAPGTVFFSEIAAGVLILLSVASYGLGNWAIGLAAGLAALFVRELAAPYVIVALVLAVGERRWREVAAWGFGLVAYAVYFGWHAQMVAAQLGPSDPAYPDSWLQFGGLGFALRTAQVDGLLFALPLWVTAIVLPLALLGLAGWRAGTRAALTVAAYLAAFLIVGKPFNTYWGALYTPLLAFGLAALPAVVRDLATVLRRSPPS